MNQNMVRIDVLCQLRHHNVWFSDVQKPVHFLVSFIERKSVLKT